MNLHKLTFKPIYEEKPKPEERKKMKKTHKPHVHVKPHMFEEIKAVYRNKGTGIEAVNMVKETLGVSRETARKHLHLARADYISASSPSVKPTVVETVTVNSSMEETLNAHIKLLIASNDALKEQVKDLMIEIRVYKNLLKEAYAKTDA